MRLRHLLWSSLLVVFACSDSPTSSSSSELQVNGGGQCSISTCTGDGCASFSPANGEYLVANDLKKMSAPDSGSPFVPLQQRQIRVGQHGKWLRPSIPPQRTTGDGRVAVTFGLGFRAMRLELLRDQPVMRSHDDLGDELESNLSGDQVFLTFSDGSRVTDADLVPATKWNRATFKKVEAGVERTICEYQHDQPRACARSPGEDCYDVKLIQHVQITTDDGHAHLGLESIPIRIVVANPKTPQARVVRAVADDKSTWQRSPLAPFSAFEEGLNTRDGHMLVGRATDSNNTTTAPFEVSAKYTLSDGKVHDKPFTLAYSYAEHACDVGEWMAQTNGAFTSLRPLSAAPYDPRINGNGKGDPKYGIAARPFRDPLNHVIAEDEILPGSYPWTDKEARNVIFSTVNPRLFNDTRTAARFPIKHTGTLEKFGEGVGGSQRGFSVVGNWTEGKVVLLDDMLNNDDVGVFPDDEYEFGLYGSGTDHVAVRVNGGGKLETGKLDLLSAHANNHHIDSTENMSAMHAKSAAVTPRDVVWTISRGLNSDEVAFDDYIDPHVVLFAEMNAAWQPTNNAGVARYFDGFSEVSSVFQHDPSSIRLQNAATSPIYSLASVGRIDGGGRVEPIAAGGVQGRGLWLESSSDAHWDFPKETTQTVGNASFYASVFVDARESMQGDKHVFSLRPTQGTPTEVTLTDGTFLKVSHGSDVLSFDVSCNVKSYAKRWHDFGVLFEGDGHVTAFVDGNPLGYQQLATAVHLEPGAFVIGGTATVSGATGIRGWYDEARVVVNGTGDQLTQAASVELLCNYARGTMVAAASGSDEYTEAQAAPSIADRVTRTGAAHAPSGQYLYCATNYGYDVRNHGYALGVNYTPPSTTSMRAKLLLEGTSPLLYSQPRPDSTKRSFCLSCHTNQDAQRTSSLTLAALAKNQLDADMDPRTQPSQPSVMPGDSSAIIWGNIPVGWVETPGGQSLPSKHESGGVQVLDFVFRGK
jgi:hypothetical protein